MIFSSLMSYPSWLWWFVVGLASVGHFCLHLVIYNRINATGWPRWFIKVLKWMFLLACLSTPILIFFFPSPLWWFYAIICIGTMLAYGPDWLMSRPGLNRDAVEVPRQVESVDLSKALAVKLPLTLKCRLHAELPLNQIFQLAIEHKTITIPNLPLAFDGLKIAHLSDIHLTGHVSPQFYRHIVDRAVAWQPDLIAMTGDIVDKAGCLDWLPECFETAQAKHGCFFVLGNHDLRIKDPIEVRSRLESIGWIDMGTKSKTIRVDDNEIHILGNESPWFPAVDFPSGTDREPHIFRLLLSHSPDQIEWARARQVQLMLAGHTHGGQGRLPWVGPVLSPSFYGSRYASGTFFLEPTTMHVLRGISGVHLMRINCPPELALITLNSETKR